MIFGVSTLGCPGLPLREVGALLRRHGVSAVQLRCASDEPVNVAMPASARRRARGDLSELTLLGLATYVRLSSGADGFDEHLRLALDLGAPALRLMPGDGPVGAAAEALTAVAARAAGSGVRLLVETHDAFLRGADLAALLTAADAGPSVGAIWDALHPWRAGEAPVDTFRALQPWLAEVQVKDVAAPDQRTPLVPGDGNVPCREVLALARAGGFDGPVVLEHEARWYADAAPIDDAIEGALALTSVYL